MTIAEPLALTDEIVVLRRATYGALVAAVEDARDARALPAGRRARRGRSPRSPGPCASPSRTFWRSNAEGDLPHGFRPHPDPPRRVIQAHGSALSLSLSLSLSPI